MVSNLGYIASHAASFNHKNYRCELGQDGTPRRATLTSQRVFFAFSSNQKKKIATRSDRAWVWCGVFLETSDKDEISLIETEKNVSPGSFDGQISAVLSANVAGHWSK